MANQNKGDDAELLKVFPVEVWGRILENVKEPKTCHNVTNASPFFKKHLRSRAPAIFFPAVLNILNNQNVFSKNNCHPWIDIRLTCRKWKQEVDGILERQEYIQHNKTLPLDVMNGMNFDQQNVLVRKEFSDPLHFTKFEEHFDRTHHIFNQQNPFLGRKVTLCLNFENTTPDQFYTACEQFLKKYGQHVYFCIIKTISIIDLHLTSFYAYKLYMILGYMPNLRALQINSRRIPIRVTVFGVRPNLKNLEYISASAAPYLTVKNLLLENPQVRYVHAIISPHLTTVYLETLSDLSEISISIFNKVHYEFWTAAKLGEPVKRLWLNASRLNEDEVTCAQLFQTITRRLASSLQELYMSLPDGEKLGPQLRLSLQNLTILHVEMKEPQRLNFLLAMKNNLKELEPILCHDGETVSYQFNRFDIVIMEEIHNRGNFKVYVFWMEPIKSNIWSLLPKLEIFQTTTCRLGHSSTTQRCSRKEWTRMNTAG